MSITLDNWTSSHYFSEPLRAFISHGAEPLENSEGVMSIRYQYYVTMTDKDFAELFQSTHEHLEEAISLLNEKYGHWQMIDADAKVSGDGCSSCAAH